MTSLESIADENVKSRFVDNPCRGIVLGMDPRCNLVQLAWIMGRSENSQNRVYVVEGSSVRTEAADPSKVKDPSLIIYNVMSESNGAHIVSNGDQTDTVAELFAGEKPSVYGFERALGKRYCEPDVPVATPRITGFQVAGDERAYLSILRCSGDARRLWVETAGQFNEKDFKSKEEYFAAVQAKCGLDRNRMPTERHNFVKQLEPGFGYCFTTYRPGSKELPSFEGEPFVVPVLDVVVDSMKNIFDRLDERWRVSICGKFIHKDGSSHAYEYNRFAKKL